jgi:hypothetical protein
MLKPESPPSFLLCLWFFAPILLFAKDLEVCFFFEGGNVSRSRNGYLRYDPIPVGFAVVRPETTFEGPDFVVRHSSAGTTLVLILVFSGFLGFRLELGQRIVAVHGASVSAANGVHRVQEDADHKSTQRRRQYDVRNDFCRSGLLVFVAPGF